MPVSNDQLTPNTNNQGSIGTASKRWGAGYFSTLFKNGKEVAELDSPALVNNPTAPTQSAGDNSTRLATTAYADNEADVAQAYAIQRSNHTGTQPASTISDFSSAVAATTEGGQAHDQNTDTGLDTGGSNPITAATLKTHVEDATKHRVIDDTAGNGDTDVLWSANKIFDHVAQQVSAISLSVTVGDIGDAGALAALDTVSTGRIDLESITPSRLLNGPTDDSPGNNKFYGTNASGTMGFQDFSSAITLKASPGTNEARLSSDSSGIFAVTGTTSTTCAVGNDARFPSSGEKDALAGTNGTPGSSNKFVTASGLTSVIAGLEFSAADINTGTSVTNGTTSPKAIADVLANYTTTTELNTAVSTAVAAITADSLGFTGDATNYTPEASTVIGHIEGIDTKLGSLESGAAGALTTSNFETSLDGDRIDIDFAPANYSPSTSGAPEAADVDDLAAHLKGIDNILGAGAVPDADGDKLEISWNPSNYTPDSSISEADDADDLSAHLKGIDTKIGSLETLDGDQLDIDFSPSNYTPTVTGAAEAADVDDLAAHLKGIDNAISKVVPLQFEVTDTTWTSSLSKQLMWFGYPTTIVGATFSGNNGVNSGIQDCLLKLNGTTVAEGTFSNFLSNNHDNDTASQIVAAGDSLTIEGNTAAASGTVTGLYVTVFVKAFAP